MNILVIGNGFDRAHNLPTRYIDFLYFVLAFKQFEIPKTWREKDVEKKYGYYFSLFSELIKQRSSIFDELRKYINNNLWIDYFISIIFNKRKPIKDGWIDFEREISRIIRTLDESRKCIDEQLKGGNFKGIIQEWQFRILRDFFLKIDNRFKYTFPYLVIRQDYKVFSYEDIQNFTNQALVALNQLIRCFEIYLCFFVQNSSVSQLSDIKALDIDMILSFNYTDTAERLYKRKDKKQIDFDYIHGKTDIAHTIDTCNMVLGIDEYLPEGERDSDNEFIEFKKFYQRIYKQTGSHYIDWIKWRREKNKQLSEGHELEEMNVYIYGHSLDITDRDILRDLILEEGAVTTIFYYNKKDLGQKIANLVKVIGEDELIRRTGGGQSKSIIFKATTKEK